MERFFQPLELGKLKLKNRFIMAPIKTGYGTPQGEVTPRHLNFYNNISRGGVALIILEPVSVTPSGREHPKQLRVDNEVGVKGLKTIVELIHKNGALTCLNLNHAGRAANPKATGTPPKAPSETLCPSTGQTAQELSTKEIEEIISAFGTATQKALEAGFDAIEIQCGHGYLVSQFLRKDINKRTDVYGKDPLLFARKVLEEVFKNAGDTPVFIRISGSEFVEGGITPRENQSLISLAEEMGAAAIHVGFGNACETPPWYFNHMALPEEPQFKVLREIRAMTRLPLIAVGRMASKEKLQRVVEEDLADVVALGRPLIADPQLVNKLKAKSYETIIQCGYCLQGCLFNVRTGLGLSCIVNPGIDKEEPPPAKERLKCVVVGAGPAGMMAAITLSKRGHQVKVYERESVPGGQFNLVPLCPLKQTMKRPLESLIREFEQSPAEVAYGKEVDADLLKSLGPDLVIIATGSTPNIPDIEGLDTQYWITGIDFFTGRKPVKGKRVLIIGAGMVGVEAAEILSREGKTVVATKRTDTIANDMEPITRNLLLKDLNSRENVRLMPNTTVERFTPKGVEVTSQGEEMLLEPFDTVILTAGMTPHNALYEEVKGVVERAEVIGDSKEPRSIYWATQEGYIIGTKY